MTIGHGARGPVRQSALQGAEVRADHDPGVSCLQALAVDILRVRFNPSGQLAPQRSWSVLASLPAPAAEATETAADLQITTDLASLHLAKDTARISLCWEQTPFAEDRRPPAWHPATVASTAVETVPGDEFPVSAQPAIQLTKHLAPSARCFGLGQRDGRLDRRHRRFSHWTQDIWAPGHCHQGDNRYQAQPFVMVVEPALTWGLLLNSSGYTHFDLGVEEPQTLAVTTMGGELDYCVLIGPTPAAVVEQLTRLTGRPLLPPLWSLGFHQSRWSYPDQETIETLAAEFRRRRLPLDAIHLDIDYMRGYRDFTFDPERFPDPAAMNQRLARRGVRTVAIIDPGIKHDLSADYEIARDGLEQDVFIRHQDGSPFVGYCWPEAALFPDFTRTRVRRWWGDQHRALTEAGVAGVWCDMNEPSIFDRPITDPGVQEQPIPLGTPQGEHDEPTDHAEVHNLYGHLMARASHEGLVCLRPHHRPWVLTRAAFLGTQRWAAGWMGDNRSCWQDLEESLPMLANMGLTGMPHVGVDIGGFFGHAWGELYARWLELSVVYPFMRAHTALGTRNQEPWAFGPEIEALARRLLGLRYRLLPYLYTLAHEAHRSGAPLLRPLAYDFPQTRDLHDIEDQLMVGPGLMVAPVVRPGQRERLIRLPPGTWYDFWSGEACSAGAQVHPAPLGRLPLLVRSGTLLPVGNERACTDEPLIELTWLVYPGATGHGLLVEDDGVTAAGATAETPCQLVEEDNCLKVFLGRRQGAHSPPPRRLRLQIHLPQPPQQVRVDGAIDSTWQWQAEAHAIQLGWQDDGADHEVVVAP